MKKIIDRIVNFKMEKGWMWLFYLDIILPMCLFLLALLFNGSSMGISLARLFHAYNLYVLSPVPDIVSLTGIIGLAIHVGVVAYALKNRDLIDALICMVITAAAFLYIFLEVNYSLSFLLKFT